MRAKFATTLLLLYLFQCIENSLDSTSNKKNCYRRCKQQNSEMQFINAKEMNAPGDCEEGTHARLPGLQYSRRWRRQKINPIYDYHAKYPTTIAQPMAAFYEPNQISRRFFIQFISNDSASCRNETHGSRALRDLHTATASPHSHEPTDVIVFC